MIAFTAKTLYTPLVQIERPIVLVEDGRIVELDARGEHSLASGVQVFDFPDAVLAPGMIDIHIHGGGGHDVMEDDLASLPAVEGLIAKHGVTSYFPTTVTAPLDRILAALDRLATAIESPTLAAKRARPLGIHLEGPFISHARKGVHPPENLLTPSLKMFDRFWQAARGHIKMMTIAPELDGATEVIAEAVRRGVCVSVGHSDASCALARAAVDVGATHATHLFNAMRPLDHRDPGLIGQILTDLRQSADFIADGIHLDPAIVKLILETKGPDKAVLITDATAATGMPDGTYRLGSFEVEVRDGRCTHNGRLAGSVLTMDLAVRNVMRFGGCDLQSALRLATLNPAQVAGLTGRGKLEAGAAADIVVLSADGEIQNTIIAGEVL